MGDDHCPECRQRLPRHKVVARHIALTGNQRQYYDVEIAEGDPRDPFELLDPPPEPLTDSEPLEAIRALSKLRSDALLERWEATRRKLVAEVEELRDIVIKARMELAAAITGMDKHRWAAVSEEVWKAKNSPVRLAWERMSTAAGILGEDLAKRLDCEWRRGEGED